MIQTSFLFSCRSQRVTLIMADYLPISTDAGLVLVFSVSVFECPYG